MNFWSSIHERGNEDGQRPTDRPIDFFSFLTIYDTFAVGKKNGRKQAEYFDG